ncbi:MAG: HlyD family secretion protein [Syntrophobacteraceae bacterium]
MKITFRSPKSVAPDREHGMSLPYAAGKRATSRWRWYLLVLLVTAPLLFLIAKIFYAALIVTAPGFVRLERIEVNTQMAGWVKRVMVKPGETVVRGQLLAVLANQDLDQRQSLLQTELKAMTTTSAGAFPEYAKVLNALESSQNLAQKQLAYYADQFKNINFLFHKGAATIAERNAARAQLYQAQMNLQQIQSSLAARQLEEQRLCKPDRASEIKSRVIRAELDEIELQKARLVYTSPVRGRVLELRARPGQSLSQGELLLTLGNLDDICIQAFLDPKYLSYARPGHSVTVTLDDGSKFSAVVRQKPQMTARLPQAAATSLSDRQYMLLVTCDMPQTLPRNDWVDNLPVTVRFPFGF